MRHKMLYATMLALVSVDESMVHCQRVQEILARIQALPDIRPIDAYDGERWYPVERQTARIPSRSPIVSA